MYQPTHDEIPNDLDGAAIENPAAREAFEARFAEVSVLLDLLGAARRLEAEAA